MEEIIFRNGIPKKNKFILFILFSKFLLFFPFVKIIIKKYLKHCKNIYFIPGFKFLYGNIYGENISVNDTFFIDYAPIYIGKGTTFAFENIVITSMHDYKDSYKVKARPIRIGKNVWINSRCIILGGVHIGDNSIIGAGSVVSTDIPPSCFAAGNPCKVIKQLDQH